MGHRDYYKRPSPHSVLRTREEVFSWAVCVSAHSAERAWSPAQLVTWQPQRAKVLESKNL